MILGERSSCIHRRNEAPNAPPSRSLPLCSSGIHASIPPGPAGISSGGFPEAAVGATGGTRRDQGFVPRDSRLPTTYLLRVTRNTTESDCTSAICRRHAPLRGTTLALDFRRAVRFSCPVSSEMSTSERTYERVAEYEARSRNDDGFARVNVNEHNRLRPAESRGSHEEPIVVVVVVPEDGTTVNRHINTSARLRFGSDRVCQVEAGLGGGGGKGSRASDRFGLPHRARYATARGYTSVPRRTQPTVTDRLVAERSPSRFLPSGNRSAISPLTWQPVRLAAIASESALSAAICLVDGLHAKRKYFDIFL